MLLPLTCLKRDFLKVLQSLRGYIDTILPKSLGHIATLAYRQACPEAVVRGLSHIIKDTVVKRKCMPIMLYNQLKCHRENVKRHSSFQF